ncbi:SANT/Myb-like DNA-binding domain-containing protein [Bradyrhizobium erythrophlei]|uniref:SANT/Myb-like DNA-binding domain-containing protein n=1 Tax=Bradyrhizobium erythrophlei TaxID=1437360 RepID=UPI0035EEAA89
MGMVRRWSPDEDRKLEELAKAGKNAFDISNELTRSTSAVRRRAEVLSILLTAKAWRARPSHVATHLERVAIDAIRTGRPFPAGVGPSTLAGMLDKGWIVPEGPRTYRVTDAGTEAVRRKIPSS